jgi:hypothetical protein
MPPSVILGSRHIAEALIDAVPLLDVHEESDLRFALSCWSALTLQRSAAVVSVHKIPFREVSPS